MLYTCCCLPTAVRVPHAIYKTVVQILLIVKLCVLAVCPGCVSCLRSTHCQKFRHPAARTYSGPISVSYHRIPNAFCCLITGAGGASLDDIIMNSIGVPGASGAADSLLPSSGEQCIPAPATTAINQQLGSCHPKPCWHMTQVVSQHCILDFAAGPHGCCLALQGQTYCQLTRHAASRLPAKRSRKEARRQRQKAAGQCLDRQPTLDMLRMA